MWPENIGVWGLYGRGMIVACKQRQSIEDHIMHVGSHCQNDH